MVLHLKIWLRVRGRRDRSIFNFSGIVFMFFQLVIIGWADCRACVSACKAQISHSNQFRIRTGLIKTNQCENKSSNHRISDTINPRYQLQSNQNQYQNQNQPINQSINSISDPRIKAIKVKINQSTSESSIQPIHQCQKPIQSDSISESKPTNQPINQFCQRPEK